MMRIPLIVSICVMGCSCGFLQQDNTLFRKIEPVPRTSKPTVFPAPKLAASELFVGQTRFHPNGKTYDFRNGELFTGKLVDLYSNNRSRFEISMVNGLRDGNATWWDEAGRIIHKRTYESGSMNGSWIEYYPSTGQKKQEQVYQNGVEILRRGWWPNGKEHFKVVFVDGVEKSRTLWDHKGEPIEESVAPTQIGEHSRPKPSLKRSPVASSHQATTNVVGNTTTDVKVPAPDKSVEQSERDRIIKLRRENRQRRSGLRKPVIPARPPSDN